jgi:hypothetical protein
MGSLLTTTILKNYESMRVRIRGIKRNYMVAWPSSAMLIREPIISNMVEFINEIFKKAVK